VFQETNFFVIKTLRNFLNNNNNPRQKLLWNIYTHIVLLNKFCATETTMLILAGKPFLKIVVESLKITSVYEF